MKTLLTSKETYANCVNKYDEDYTAFTTEGEPRGEMKRAAIEWHCKEDYVSLQLLLGMLGLDEYFEMELHEGMLYMFYHEYKNNKRALAKEILNEINEMTKETGKLGLKLL